MIVRAALSLAMALALASCQYNPYAVLFTTEKPEAKDVAGMYTMTSQTLTADGLAALHGKICMVSLKEDSTFVASNVLEWRETLPSGNFFDNLVSGSGNWRIDSVGGVDDGWRPIKTHWGVYLKSTDAKLSAVGLTGVKPPYGLIYTLGDPDSGEVMILTRNK